MWNQIICISYHVLAASLLGSFRVWIQTFMGTDGIVLFNDTLSNTRIFSVNSNICLITSEFVVD